MVIGRLCSVKNIETILSAVNKITFPIEVHIVGDGEERKKLEKITNRAFFHGFKDEEWLKNNIKDYDIYISASFVEGLPLSLLEALSVGLPSILSDIAEHRHVASDKEVLYFQPKNTDDLIKKIEIILKNEKLRRMLGKRIAIL